MSILISPERACDHIEKYSLVTKDRHSDSYLENSNTQLNSDQPVYAEHDNCIYLHQRQSLWKIGLVLLGHHEQVIAVGRELLLRIAILICKRHGPEQQIHHLL